MKFAHNIRSHSPAESHSSGHCHAASAPGCRLHAKRSAEIEKHRCQRTQLCESKLVNQGMNEHAAILHMNDHRCRYMKEASAINEPLSDGSRHQPTSVCDECCSSTSCCGTGCSVTATKQVSSRLLHSGPIASHLLSA